MNRTEEANDEKHYILITLAVIIGVFGLYYRFAAPDDTWHVSFYNWVANIFFIIGIALGLKAVFTILK
jgi:protein-S-isoprenylcysteine O-methyltransferase Ste14